MFIFSYLLIYAIVCSQFTYSFNNIELHSNIISNDDFLNISNKLNFDLIKGKTNETKIINADVGCEEASHEQNRINGYSTIYKFSCKNWTSSGYSGYGIKDIPYWINTQSINNKSKEELFISDIRTQTNIWNLARIEDTGENIVNFYEVGEGSSTLPAPINGKKVLEIKSKNLNNYAGLCYYNDLRIEINFDNSQSSFRHGRNIDTPMHELGHILCLEDLDGDSQENYGTHKALMGYSRKTTESNLLDALTYHDIQGAAYLNGVHTEHDFRRYYLNINKYCYVCFYCDLTTESFSKYSGSSQLIFASNCDHEYEPIVSLGDKYWLKCSKCYKVIEHYHDYTETYINYTNMSHRSYCWCGDYIQEEHQFNDHYCVCGRYTSTHNYHEPYIWKSLEKHNSTCGCGDIKPFGHVVSGDNNLDPRDPYKKCLLCNGNASIGFSTVNSSKALLNCIGDNGSYILDNGVIVLSTEDLHFFSNKLFSIYDLLN